MKPFDSVVGRRVSIFLAVGTCMCSARPSAGRITRVVYKPGKFYAAMRGAASEKNEQNVIYMETPERPLSFSNKLPERSRVA